jgi:DNA helicase-2/ATP-dependent DNA helicase PcrA
MDFSGLLNDRQYEAVKSTEGPLLIIAGAGSGKTRVLTYRIAYLMQEKHVDPWNIMAITFTNKAANEMRERVNDIAGHGAEAVWVSTFHSACARILRRYIERIGYTASFSIYDTDDSKRVLKDIVSGLNIDSKKYPPKRFQYEISHAKNHMISVGDMEKDASSREEEITAQVYRAYEEALFKNNALDFDDLLIKTVELFEKAPDVLEGYQNRLRYIMVDEYQDTNRIQFRLVGLLASKYRNLCVVGDDDQSIYKFRGADIRNILDFERVFPDAKVVKLEQNYRSAGNILKGANSVIKNNTEHKEKTLWTAKEDGELIHNAVYQSGFEEAQKVAEEIKRMSAYEGLNSFAILYRTNAQSRLFEEQFIRAGIPYRLVGGVNFYARKEIKDILAYLKTIENGRDELAVRRIINIPRRGIGDKSIERISEYAAEKGMTFFEAVCEAKEIPGAGRAGGKAEEFSLFIRKFKALSEEYPVEKLIKTLIDETGYVKELEAEGTDEDLERIANIDELISKAASYEETAEEPSLGGFLQEVALVADIDTLDENAERVVLMTIHSAKGLEFDNVYMVGMEDGLFPGFRTIFDIDDSELEEERRLFYVGMTRARKRLKLTSARSRIMRGEQEFHKISRFVEEIPKELIEDESGVQSYHGYGTGPARTDAYDTEGGRSASREAHGGFERRVKKPDEVPYKKAFDPSQFKITKAASLDYSAGDTVMHKKFGRGTVVEIKDGERDYEVTVDFETAGRKKMFAGFAKLEKQ